MITLSSKWSLPDSISIPAIILSHTLVLYLQAECKMKHIKVWGKWKKVIVLKAFFFLSFFFSDNKKMSNPNLRPFWYLNSSDVSGRRFHTEGEKQFSGHLSVTPTHQQHSIWPDLTFFLFYVQPEPAPALKPRLAPVCPVTVDLIRLCVFPGCLHVDTPLWLNTSCSVRWHLC